MRDTMESLGGGESVADFYAGKSIFITGGTGFIGKVIIEKLLYSCPKLDKIYILIRDKKNENPECRLQKIFNSLMFKRLVEKRGKSIFEKLVPIVGDIAEENLGISENDEKILLDKIKVVFHVAATIKFNEPLKVAMNINFEGTRRILRLSKKMKSLEKLIYVSTAYSNTNRDVIEEVVYPPPASYEDVNVALEGSREYMERIERILSDFPNTYVFTKSLCENYVAENHGKIPALIIRPSVVTASTREPLAGWIDNWFGATRILTSIGMGYLRVLCGDASNVIDLIPVDYVSNAIITAAAKGGRSDEVEVYNCCSSEINPLTLGYISNSFIDEISRLKLNPVPYPTITFTTNRLLTWIILFLTQIFPSYVMDCLLRVIGREPRYMKIQTKIIKLFKSLEYFTAHSWIFCSKRTVSLFNSLSASDRDTFPFDPANIVWSKYLVVYINGVKTHLF